MQIQNKTDKEETPTNETSDINSAISKKLIFSIMIVIWSITVWLLDFSLDLIILYNSQKEANSVLTPFIFIGVIFISALICTDSLIKTIKYNYRARESIISNFIQSFIVLGLAAFTWWNSK